MALNWTRDVYLQLRDGWCVRDGNGQELNVVTRGLVAFDGGFAHIIVAGLTEIQVVPAVAVWRASYPAKVRRVHRPERVA
jgi:hypothetical protein